jgi:calpain-7
VANPRFELNITRESPEADDIWILLSQHVTSKDRPLDDIALHIFDDQGSLGQRGIPRHASQVSVPV